MHPQSAFACEKTENSEWLLFLTETAERYHTRDSG